MTLQELDRLLRTVAFRVRAESELQAAIGQVLDTASVIYRREVWLNDKDRIDFMVGRIGVEVKVKGTLPQVTIQLHRYVKSENLDAILLVTTCSRHMGAPALQCIRPGAMGSKMEFNREWCQGSMVTDPVGFGCYLRDSGLMLTRTRKDVGRELPPVTKIPHYVDADPRVFDRVKDSAAELARIILAQSEDKRGDKMEAGGRLDNLMRQATGLAKSAYVAEFVRLLVENGEPVVLFGWHRAVYEIWNERLKDLNPVMYTGSESKNQKEQAKQDFLSGKSKVFIISLRSGAGLEGLQNVCRTSVHGELDWSPGVHEQNIGRLDREIDGVKDMSQQEPVVAYFMVSEEGSDPLMAEVLGMKIGQIQGIRNASANVIERLQSQDGRMKRLAEMCLQRREVAAHA